MKLFIELKAERLIGGKWETITKTQGSNGKIMLIATLDKRPLVDIEILPSGTIVVEELEEGALIVQRYEGERQKDEVLMCNDCAGMTDKEKENCQHKSYAIEKGERQKGETIQETQGVCPSCGGRTANGYAVDSFNPCKYCK